MGAAAEVGMKDFNDGGVHDGQGNLRDDGTHDGKFDWCSEKKKRKFYKILQLQITWALEPYPAM